MIPHSWLLNVIRSLQAAPFVKDDDFSCYFRRDRVSPNRIIWYTVLLACHNETSQFDRFYVVFSGCTKSAIQYTSIFTLFTNGSVLAMKTFNRDLNDKWWAFFIIEKILQLLRFCLFRRNCKTRNVFELKDDNKNLNRAVPKFIRQIQ